MKQMRTDPRRVGAVSGILTIVVFALILFSTGVPAVELLPALARGTLALSVTGVFWWAYNKYLWRYRLFRFFGWLSPFPDLSGRWEGTVVRTVGDTPHNFVLEVTQSFTTLSYRTFTKNSRGESLAAALIWDEESNTYGVMATWQTKSKSLTHPGEMETFRGASSWRLVIVDNPGHVRDKLSIVDEYHTDRMTSGRLELRRTIKPLLNRF